MIEAGWDDFTGVAWLEDTMVLLVASMDGLVAQAHPFISSSGQCQGVVIDVFVQLTSVVLPSCGCIWMPICALGCLQRDVWSLPA